MNVVEVESLEDIAAMESEDLRMCRQGSCGFISIRRKGMLEVTNLSERDMV